MSHDLYSPLARRAARRSAFYRSVWYGGAFTVSTIFFVHPQPKIISPRGTLGHS
jgi:hypothetical protein